jgi:hypothetical protein
MTFSMTGQEKGDLLIQVIAWFDRILYPSRETRHPSY